MNQFKNKPYADVDEFDHVIFILMKTKNVYNLDLHFGTDNGINGMVMRTSIYTKSIIDMVPKIRNLLATNVFDHLAIVTSSMVFNESGEVEFEFDYDDYGDIGDYENGMNEFGTIN